MRASYLFGLVLLVCLSPSGPLAASPLADTPAPTATPEPATPTPGVSAVPIQVGWNLLGLPSPEVGPYTAGSLLADLASQGIGARQVSRWEGGTWQSHVQGFAANDFPVEPGRGYFVRATSGGVWRPRPLLAPQALTPTATPTMSPTATLTPSAAPTPTRTPTTTPTPTRAANGHRDARRPPGPTPAARRRRRPGRRPSARHQSDPSHCARIRLRRAPQSPRRPGRVDRGPEHFQQP